MAALQARKGARVPGALQRDDALRIGGNRLHVGACRGGGRGGGIGDGRAGQCEAGASEHRQAEGNGKGKVGAAQVHQDLQGDQKVTVTSRP